MLIVNKNKFDCIHMWWLRHTIAINDWTNVFCSNVPTANDVLVPETLLKKNKANAKAAEVAAADKVAARKASIGIL